MTTFFTLTEDNLLTGNLSNFLEEVEFKSRLTQEASAKGILGLH